MTPPPAPHPTPEHRLARWVAAVSAEVVLTLAVVAAVTTVFRSPVTLPAAAAAPAPAMAMVDGQSAGGAMDHGSAQPGAMDHDAMDHDAPAAAAAGETYDVRLRMDEYAFTPMRITVPAGQPVRFLVTNAGAAEHEVVIGDAHAQDDAEKAMAGGGHGGHRHDTPSLSLAPGASGELTATFDQAGELLLGCHVPGHWAAGMRGTLVVR